MALKSAQERQVRDTIEVGKLYFKWDSYLHNFFVRSAIFPYNSLYTQAVAYTTYFELGEPVFSPARFSKLCNDITPHKLLSCTAIRCEHCLKYWKTQLRGQTYTKTENYQGFLGLQLREIPILSSIDRSKEFAWFSRVHFAFEGEERLMVMTTDQLLWRQKTYFCDALSNDTSSCIKIKDFLVIRNLSTHN